MRVEIKACVYTDLWIVFVNGRESYSTLSYSDAVARAERYCVGYGQRFEEGS